MSSLKRMNDVDSDDKQEIIDYIVKGRVMINEDIKMASCNHALKRY